MRLLILFKIAYYYFKHKKYLYYGIIYLLFTYNLLKLFCYYRSIIIYHLLIKHLKFIFILYLIDSFINRSVYF